MQASVQSSVQPSVQPSVQVSAKLSALVSLHSYFDFPRDLASDSTSASVGIGLGLNKKVCVVKIGFLGRGGGHIKESRLVVFRRLGALTPPVEDPFLG